MSGESLQRVLAAHYASRAAYGPIPAELAGQGCDVIDVLEEIELLDPVAGSDWRRRLERLTHDQAARPLLPEEVRHGARAYVATAEPRVARRALEAVGALSWRDGDRARMPGMVVEQVYPVPPNAADGVTVSALVRYEDATEVLWYAPASGHFGLGLADDQRTAYASPGSGHSSAPAGRSPAHTLFTPAPPAEARWLEVTRDGTSLARVHLA